MRISVLTLLLVIGCSESHVQERQAEPADAAPAMTPLSDATGELRAALQRLVQGVDSPAWFSSETAEVLKTVELDAHGKAIVDFRDLRPLIPNASSSAGSEQLLNELNAAVFAVEQVQSVEYRMLGSCALFWEWLQYGCQVVTRDMLQEN